MGVLRCVDLVGVW